MRRRRRSRSSSSQNASVLAWHLLPPHYITVYHKQYVSAWTFKLVKLVVINSCVDILFCHKQLQEELLGRASHWNIPQTCTTWDSERPCSRTSTRATRHPQAWSTPSTQQEPRPSPWLTWAWGGVRPRVPAAAGPTRVPTAGLMWVASLVPCLRPLSLHNSGVCSSWRNPFPVSVFYLWF